MRQTLFILALLLLDPTVIQADDPPVQEEVREEDSNKTEPEKAKEEIEEVVKQGDLGVEAYKINVSGSIDLNYVFAESPDTFIVTYKYSFEGLVRNKVDIVKGKGKIETSVKGYLAKWPTGECLLDISVAEFGYELNFNKIEEEKAKLDVKFDGEMLEKWESNCSFTDAPGKKFTTSGNMEKWVRRAFYNIKPPPKGLDIEVDRLHKQTTSKEFQIEQFQVADPPLGSVEMEGKGKISLIPTEL